MLKMFTAIKFCHFFASKNAKIYFLHYGSFNCHLYNIIVPDIAGRFAEGH